MTRSVGGSDVSARGARGGNRGLSPRLRGPGLNDTQEAGVSGVSEAAEAPSNEEGNPLETGGGPAIPGNDRESDYPDVEDVKSGRGSESDGGEEEDDGGFTAELALVPVEAPVNWHTSWEAWQTYFADYCQRTMQVLPVKETMSRAERNKRLKKTRKRGDDSQLVPEQFDPYQRAYICTHGWKKRKSRSEGSRPRQHIRLTDCPFRFIIQWNLSRGELQLKNGTFVHNHRVSPAAFATYPASQGIADPLVDARVQGMLSVGAKRSKIYDYLPEHDQNVIQVDVDNLVRDHGSSISSLNDNDATAREIAIFASADSENVCSVSETDAGETGVISLVSAHMRRIYSRFSEVLLVDCSHKTKRYNYQLLTFMAMNEFGEGAVVQQSLIEANGDWHMERAIDHFKRSHPTRISMLRVLVVDKDMSEIRALELNFPKARILICHFHVIKYLNEMRARPEFGKVSSEDASPIDGAIHKMVYAVCEEQYKTAHESLKGLCQRIGLVGIFDYFQKNWDSCQDGWVYYLRSKLPHFKNHTNNRLENYFGKLKDAVDGSMSMAGCVKALIAYDRRIENEYKYRLSRIGQFVNSNYDEEMNNVLRFTTHFVAQQIEHQYATALSKAAVYSFTVDPDDADHVVVGGVFSEHNLRIDDWRCDCDFSMSMCLPCCHAIAYHKHTNVIGPVIPWCRIDERWTCSSRHLNKLKQFSYEKFTNTERGSTKNKLRTHSERYREAVKATHLIANEMADIESEVEFEEMLRFVLDQWRNVRQRKSVPMSNSEGGGEWQGDEQCGDGDEEDAEKQIPVRNFTEDAIQAEFNISSSEGEEAYESSGKVKIRLNPKAKKVGRPQKQKKSTSAGEKKGRKWYEASEAGRKVAGEVTLSALINSLDREQPGLMETQRRLSGVLMKHGEAENKKPKLKILKNPVLIQDPFYILPEKLLDACMKLLPVSNTANHAISIDDSQNSQDTGSIQLQGSIETIWIKDVGNFSRAQIETFKRVHNLMQLVKLGLNTHKWLVQEGCSSLPAEYHAIATSDADEILSTCPKKRIEGLPNLSDFQYALLYRVSPPTWLTDASIRALCIRLCEDYSSCRFAGFQSAVARSKRTRTEEPVVDHNTRGRLIKMAREDGVDTVLLPLNFSSFHWCCVVVKVHAKRIYYYDPLHQRPYIKAANAVANSLKIGGLTEYDVIPQNKPIQFDGFSCGVYVCWMFIRQVSTAHPVDISVASPTERRFELFYYMLKGHLLPIHPSGTAEQDDTEEKRPAVAQHEDMQQTQEEEQVGQRRNK